MAFFVIAYLISWAAWITLFARHLSHLVGLGMWLYLLAVLAPHASVSIRRWKLEAQASEAFYRIVTRPAPPRGCAVTISIPPIVYLVRDAIAVAFHLPHPSFLYHPRRTLAALIFGQLAVTVGEEPGWRASRCPDWSAASVPDLRNAHARKCMGLLASTCLLGSWHSTVRSSWFLALHCTEHRLFNSGSS